MSSQKAMINTMTFYHWDENLFEGLQVPEGVSKDDTVASILLESSDFPVIITNLETLKFSIGLWSRHRLPIWEHWHETTQYEYNPIENYDRREQESYTLNKEGSGSVKGDGGADTMTFNTTLATTGNTTNSGSDTVTNSGDDVTTRDGQDSRTRSESNDHSKTGSDTSTESVSAFNESGYADHTQTVTDYNTTDDIDISESEDITRDETITLAHGKVETTMHGAVVDSTGSDRKTGTETRTSLAGENRTEESTDTFEKEVYIHGNIGVTTSQQMIEAERNIADFDIVDIIVKEYIKEFCIMVY